MDRRGGARKSTGSLTVRMVAARSLEGGRRGRKGMTWSKEDGAKIERNCMKRNRLSSVPLDQATLHKH